MPRNNVGPQKRLEPRRRAFYKLMMEGNTLPETLDIICKSYNVKRTALYDDWKHRENWGNFVIPDKKEDTFLVQDALNRIDDLRAKMHEIYKDPMTTIAEKIKVGKILINLELNIIEAYQTLGKVHREATTIRIEEEKEKIQKIVTDIAGEDVETQEKVVGVLLEYARSNLAN